MRRIFGKTGPMLSHKNLGMDHPRQAAKGKALKPFGQREQQRAAKRLAKMKATATK